MTTNEDFEEIPIVLRLNKNIAEVARILSICYSDYNTVKDEMLSEFISQEVTKIIKSLAADPPSPPTFPESLKQLLKEKVNEDTAPNNLPGANNNDLRDLK